MDVMSVVNGWPSHTGALSWSRYATNASRISREMSERNRINESTPARVLPHLVHGHDVGMAQACDRHRLAPQPRRITVLEDLHRDRALEPGIPGLVHHAHPALAHLPDDLVAAD